MVVDLVKLGLSGDTESVQQYVRTQLRQTPSSDQKGALREELARLLLGPSSAARMTRRVRDRIVAPPEPMIPLTAHVEWPGILEAPSPVLPPILMAELEAIVAERVQSELLRKAGVEPTRSVLFTGPPGSGKTMAARFLVSRLGLPLVTLDLASVMSSYLGRTAQNLRETFDHARREPCGVFLDEFDAIGKRRDDPADVGELKRLVNVLLLELDRWSGHGLLIAATNHPELLDRAVWRRFDRVITLGPPGGAERREILARSLQVDRKKLDHLVLLTSDYSAAELVRLANESARAGALSHRTNATEVAEELATRRLEQAAFQTDGDARERYAWFAHEVLRMPQRDVGAKLGVSHVTVGRLVRKFSAQRETEQGESGVLVNRSRSRD